MQTTRRLILQYLKERGSATVDELAAMLHLTSVTVRHHLDILRNEGLVAEPVIRHRSTPGRPQYAYALTEKASEHFPKNYCDLASKVLEEVRTAAPPHGVGAFFEAVAARMAGSAPPLTPGEPMEDRLDRAALYLNTQGYVAHWEPTAEGFRLHTCNCPYEALADENPELCRMDLSLVGQLLGCAPRCVCRVSEGASTCSYVIDMPSAARSAEQAGGTSWLAQIGQEPGE
jgi:predicted ArsR family transcriptional regulator